MNDTNNKRLFQFTENLKVLNRSEGTIKAYTMQIKLFLKQQDPSDLKAITSTDMESWVASLFDYKQEDGKGYTTGTICLKVRSLKRFFEFLESANIIFINPMEEIREPKQDKYKKIPRDILTKAEITKLLDQPNLSTRTGIRDRTVLELFYSTGIRLQELCKLSIFDIDLQGKMVRINQGKGRKDRVVPMGKHAVRFLREYITKIRPEFSKKNRKSRVLFLNQLGDPLSKQVVSIMIRNCVKRAGLTNKKISAHTFRHTFASVLVKNGADVVAVQKMLGHTDLSTTQGYIRTLGVNLKKIHSKSHPREKDKVSRKSIKPDIKRMRPEYATRK
jgi:integrase/recombinase XerD